MAWDIAAYAIAVAVLTVAAALTIGIVKVARSLALLEHTIANVGREAEVSLSQCKELAGEAREAIAASKRKLQGFATLAEGARALGDAAQAAAQAAVSVTELYRECLTAPFQATSGNRDRQSDDLDLADIGRRIWTMWRKRSDKEQEQPSDSCRQPRPSADPSEGE
ncbi:hypothetical protein [Cohnella lupini]|uniref:DUF948 domain-containing protein n=1 Tax=Cohnella lupini TaxID=1294267 RepID=A0A3D9IV01_9BACL|nr:hypothetical protein [Cohnella lupini]RED65561.1 hypothetical protein DFP95_10149 [Cohnella lupini]